MDKFVLYNLDELLDKNILSDGAFIKKLIAFGEKYGYNGNIWQAYLAYRIISDENSFSLAAERCGSSSTLRGLALLDCGIFKKLLSIEYLKENCVLFDAISNFSTKTIPENFFGKRLNALVKNLNLAETPEAILMLLRADYNASGAGELSMYEAFRLNTYGKKTELEPVTNLDLRGIEHIVGYENQKNQLLENTRAFILGKTYANVLLYGDAGTGKSSSIKALIPEFSNNKLKIIEVYKHQYIEIPKIMSEIDGRGFMFILYLDDLSFEDFETEYKYFKAVLEGGLGSRPKNVAVYATSNRMHLIKENFSDQNDMSRDEIHRSDTVEEKLSLSMRFGLRLYYPAPDQIEFLNIVHTLAESNKINIDSKTLEQTALTWAMSTNSKKTGRSAEQFISQLKNKIK